MRVRVLTIVAAALLALTFGGCGDKSGSDQTQDVGDGNPPAEASQNITLDGIDPCVLLTDQELQTFFGEPVGEKAPKDGATLKGCEVDNASATSFVSVTVQVSPVGDKKQFDHSKSVATNPVTIDGVGDEAFSWYDDDEAYVEVRHSGALIVVGMLPYPGTGKIDDPTAVVDKLTVLAKLALTRA